MGPEQKLAPNCYAALLWSHEPRLTSSGAFWTNTPEKALRTEKNTMNQSAVARSASGILVGMKCES